MYSLLFFTIFEFCLTLFRAHKPKLSDSRELWDTRPASECDDDAATAKRHNIAKPQSAPPALGHRVATGLRRARQLFRSRESFRVARCSAERVRNDRGDVRYFIERVQLDLCGSAIAFGIVAGPLWRATRRYPQYHYLEHRVLRRGHCDGNWQLIWRAIPAGSWRGPHISG